MRTGKDVHSWGNRTYKENIPVGDIKGNPIREYAAVLPSYVKCFTEYLRADGYFCSNNQKTDYQFAAPITSWDQNNGKAHWRNRPKNSPFFSVFNIGTTHESKLWKHEHLPLTVNPKNVTIPPYLPDNKTTRKNCARHYSNVELMDAEVGKIIQELKEDGLYDTTIIFFYSDHGGPLPRQKREILDSGLKVPFLVKSLNSQNKGRTDRLISFTDLAPSVLGLAGITPPKHLDGKAFLGKKTKKSRNYVYGSSDRFDEYTDRIRSIRNKQFLYLKNYFPGLPKYKDVGYRKNIPMMNEMLLLNQKKQLTPVQSIWFGTKTTEELYDCKADPHNLRNLANNPKYSKILKAFRKEMISRNKHYVDLGQLPESELLKKMWPNNKQPKTALVSIKISGKEIVLSSSTKGASIAYILSNNPDLKLDYNNNWKLYSKPITKNTHLYIYTIAERIGYKESPITLNKI